MKSLYTVAVALEDSFSGEAADTDAVWMTRFTVLDSSHSRRMTRTASAAAFAEVLYCQEKVVTMIRSTWITFIFSIEEARLPVSLKMKPIIQPQVISYYIPITKRKLQEGVNRLTTLYSAQIEL